MLLQTKTSVNPTKRFRYFSNDREEKEKRVCAAICYRLASAIFPSEKRLLFKRHPSKPTSKPAPKLYRLDHIWLNLLLNLSIRW
jgi:hypothetical protein